MVKYFLTLFFIVYLLIIPNNAEAYLDPGTASFIVQIIISAFATAIISVRLFWNKILKIFFYFFHRRDEK